LRNFCIVESRPEKNRGDFFIENVKNFLQNARAENVKYFLEVARADSQKVLRN